MYHEEPELLPAASGTNTEKRAAHPSRAGEQPLFAVCPICSREQLSFLVVHILDSHLRRYYCTTSTCDGRGAVDFLAGSLRHHYGGGISGSKLPVNYLFEYTFHLAVKNR